MIAADGRIGNTVADAFVAWHAGEYNATHLGVEIVKRDPSRFRDVVTPAQYRTLAWWLKAMSEKYGFALTKSNLPQHRETIQGIRVGKIDLGEGFDRGELEQWLG